MHSITTWNKMNKYTSAMNELLLLGFDNENILNN